MARISKRYNTDEHIENIDSLTARILMFTIVWIIDIVIVVGGCAILALIVFNFNIHVFGIIGVWVAAEISNALGDVNSPATSHSRLRGYENAERCDI